MEASSTVLLDQGLCPKRNNHNSSAPAFKSSGNNHYHIDNNCFLLRGQQLIGVPDAGFLGPRPPLYSSCPVPVPTYSSPPPSNIPQPPHPPLLPLPFSKSFSLPSPSPLPAARRAAGAAKVHSATNKEVKKLRSSPAKPQKDVLPGGTRPQRVSAAATSPVRVPKSAAPALTWKDQLPSDEDEATDDVYSLSPPPSSLPMPRFCLKARALSSLSTCNAESFGAGVLAGAGVDVGASDDLRRLLRL